MSMKPRAPAVDLQKAMIDPGAAFRVPEDVRDHPALSQSQKIEILKRWEYDAVEDDVASEEGMAAGKSSLLRRISLSLEIVTGGTQADHPAPTKHGSH